MFGRAAHAYPGPHDYHHCDADQNANLTGHLRAADQPNGDEGAAPARRAHRHRGAADRTSADRAAADRTATAAAHGATAHRAADAHRGADSAAGVELYNFYKN